jgi:F0F1-type ATP synthase membrane subunit a
MINTLGIIIISLYLIYTMYKNGLGKYIIPFALSYLLMNPMASFYLLDYSDLIYILIEVCNAGEEGK